MPKENGGPIVVPKMRFEDELKRLVASLRIRKMRHYVPTDKEFSYFVVAREIWPEMIEKMFKEFDFKFSGVGAVFIKK